MLARPHKNGTMFMNSERLVIESIPVEALPIAPKRHIGGWQVLAMLLCVALALLMIINNQMGGEAMWFWYGTVFLHGAKLYTELHTALQPFFVLEIAEWMRLFGIKIAVYELPSLLHAVLLTLGLYLLLRESSWPDWQKAVVLLGGFVYTVAGHSYRFDDYHVVAEALIVYALLLLLMIGRPGEREHGSRKLLLIAALGLVCGLTVVTRLTDGAAIVTASGLSLLFLLRGKRPASLALFAAVAALTVILVVKLTGDTLSAYISSSVFRAASSKGGTSSILAAPLLMIRNTIHMASEQKRIEAGVAFLFLVGAVTAHYWKRGVRYIIPMQLGFAGMMFLVAAPPKKVALEKGLLFETLVLVLTLLMYVAAALVIVRFTRYKQGKGSWDPREVLIFVPILEWASYSAGAAAEPLTNYYAPVALLLLLIAVVQPFRRSAIWFNPSLVTVMGLVALTGITAKAVVPYSWQNYRYPPMFENRVRYVHPVYGDMYIDRELLQFSERVCSDIGALPGKPGPELLSLPYPYPNYFCNTPPWHNYVQTFFDTATRGTIEHMMQELQNAPPQWIVYQRQLNIMKGSEQLYNHGRPIAQRDLDTLIMKKLASGEWSLVDRSDYLKPDKASDAALGTGWYIIRTRP